MMWAARAAGCEPGCGYRCILLTPGQHREGLGEFRVDGQLPGAAMSTRKMLAKAAASMASTSSWRWRAARDSGPLPGG